MIFNNIIYFIIALFIYSISYPGKTHEDSFSFTILMLFVTWLPFAAYCRLDFQLFLKRWAPQSQDEGRMTNLYHRSVTKLSVFAILLFAIAVYLFNLKYWIQLIPGVRHFSVLHGVLALSLFFFYLSTIWYFAYPAYRAIFRTGIARRTYIYSNIKLNLPILFPWVALSFIYDLVELTPWANSDSFLNSISGQLLFFAVFLTILMVFMPGVIQHWWGCKPLEPSQKSTALRAFLRAQGFRYRHLLNWPIFEGRMLTAGIMGIVPRYRYILMTDSLLEVLSLEELEAVLAHEIGHAKYRHLLFYVLFLVGYVVLSFGLFDVFFYFFASQPFFYQILSGQSLQSVNLFYLVLGFPLLVSLFVYFRFVMGFFMRNFERQADLYSAETMGTPNYTIASLEKIAFLSGKSRNVPSWHHFSIRQRVDYLWKTLRDPGLFKRHKRFVGFSFLCYLLCIVVLGYFLNYSPFKERVIYRSAERLLSQQIQKEPENILLYENLAVIYQQTGRYEEAISAYEKILNAKPDQAASLNNLAWLLVTVPDEALRNPGRGLVLAKRAVAIDKSPVFLDTLAEAYFANGDVQEALKTIEEALNLATDNRSYYRKQKERFLRSTK